MSNGGGRNHDITRLSLQRLFLGKLVGVTPRRILLAPSNGSAAAFGHTRALFGGRADPAKALCALQPSPSAAPRLERMEWTMFSACLRFKPSASQHVGGMFKLGSLVGVFDSFQKKSCNQKLSRGMFTEQGPRVING